MKYLIAIWAISAASMAYASCTYNTYCNQGRCTTCTTCCYGNNCTTNCYQEAVMKIDIHITDATPEQLMAIAKAMGVKKAKEKDAPYGYKKDGTPRKKVGRPIKETT